jgi:hypothetical protein
MNFGNLRIQSAGVGILVFAVLLVQYCLTLAPTVLHIDSGELAAIQYSLGVAHPTGYPIFTLLGYLFLKLPLFDRPIVQVNFLSALWTAAGVALMSSGLFLYFQSDYSNAKKAATEKPTPLHSAIISLATGLIFGSTLTVWAQATSIEVYSLHLLILSLIFWLLFEAWQKNQVKNWVVLAAFLGLGFSNHMTTLMVMPMVAFLYLHRNGLNKKSLQGMIFPALTGLVILILSYGFLLWRAGHHTPISWGNLHDWTSLKRHMTGHQYRNWMLAGSKVAAKNLGEFLKALPKEWAFFGPVLMIIGIRSAFQFNRIWAWSLVTAMVFNIFYVTQYDIKDLEPYFLLTMAGMAFFLAFGLKTILSKWNKPYLAFSLLLLPILAMGLNWKASDQSKTRFFETYSKTILKSVEPNALILSQQWDFLVTPYYYFKVAENEFGNILMVDKELMKRSWYILGQLPQMDPTIYKGAEKEKEIFLTEVEPFENEKAYDGNRIEEAFQNLISKILIEQHKVRPVYLTLEYATSREIRIPKGYQLIPMGLVARLEKNGYPYLPFSPPSFPIQFPENWTQKGPNQYYSTFIKEKWNVGCELRYRYETQFGKSEEAQKWANAQIQP